MAISTTVFSHSPLFNGGGFCDNPACHLRALPIEAAGCVSNIGQIQQLSYEYAPTHLYSGQRWLKIEFGNELLEREQVSVEINGVVINGWFCSHCAAVLKMVGGQ